MTYDEFHRQLGKAGLSFGEFADLVKMNRNSVTNYGKSGEVPNHLAVIAALLGGMAEQGIDFRSILGAIDIEPKKPRGAATKGRFGGSKQMESKVTTKCREL
ncbi:DNA-binding protein [Pseudogulbenkiania subflava]|uniref:DNA-binding protein n=1 Tax=Pseudogulbenkiania subflava TaxID=451637 RepID=UPI000A148DB6|nr:DNA-binding protein [Pseudogulbenkiania subflava]